MIFRILTMLLLVLFAQQIIAKTTVSLENPKTYESNFIDNVLLVTHNKTFESVRHDGSYPEMNEKPLNHKIKKVNSVHWPEAADGRIPTKNKTGFMFLEISGTSPEFIHNASKCSDMIVDLGCAYGVVSLPALQHAHCKVVAFDLSAEHLEILNLSVPKEEANRFTTVHGRFPDDFKFANNSIDAIHSSYMFHFLNGMDTEKGLYKCYQALKPGGKLYINTLSVYFNLFKGVLSAYEEKSARGDKWPGEIYNLREHFTETSIHTAAFAHVYKINDFERLLINAGFTIDKIFYYDLQEPAWFASEGKGFIGVIATKR